MNELNVKKDNFKRLAEARVTKAIKAIQNISYLSNKRNYDFDHNDSKKILKALRDEVKAVEDAFAKVEKEVSKFKL